MCVSIIHTGIKITKTHWSTLEDARSNANR